MSSVKASNIWQIIDTTDETEQQITVKGIIKQLTGIF